MACLSFQAVLCAFIRKLRRVMTAEAGIAVRIGADQSGQRIHGQVSERIRADDSRNLRYGVVTGDEIVP